MAAFTRAFLRKSVFTHKSNRNVIRQCSSVGSHRVVFSGIQPTGTLHLGNYFGAVKQWLELQETEKCFFSIVDLHAITLPQDPSNLHEKIFEMTATLLGCGIDPKKSVLFQQSRVPLHTELGWVLGCLSTLPRLGHFPQYKEKSSLVKEVPLGLFIYPVLQSADILLYKTTHVPVGEDQLQHIQLAQHLAKIFNNQYGMVFPNPKPITRDEHTSRVRSLRVPDKKMSKSEKDARSRIELLDPPEVIIEKLKKAVTDFISVVTFDPEQRPGVSNLIHIHSLCTGESAEEICRKNGHIDTGRYKMVVADAVNDAISPVRTRIQDLMRDRSYLDLVLREGCERANEVAEKTWKEVCSAVGFHKS